MAFRGEDVLDECLSFATKTLKSIKVSPSFQNQIDLALRVPVWKFVPRSLARHSIDLYSMEAQHNQKLLTFAKFDFNMVQHCHQQELRQLADWWWGTLDVATNFPYARDRLVESYYCFNSVFFEPKYELGRIIGTKIWLIMTILDDTFDTFATYEDVQILAEAIDERFLITVYW
ncbi:Alpha-copaene synthase [Linum grandiflorum]